MKPDCANIAFAASTQIRFEIALKTQTQHVVWKASRMECSFEHNMNDHAVSRTFNGSNMY